MYCTHRGSYSHFKSLCTQHTITDLEIQAQHIHTCAVYHNNAYSSNTHITHFGRWLVSKFKRQLAEELWKRRTERRRSRIKRPVSAYYLREGVFWHKTEKKKNCQSSTVRIFPAQRKWKPWKKKRKADRKGSAWQSRKTHLMIIISTVTYTQALVQMLALGQQSSLPESCHLQPKQSNGPKSKLQTIINLH